MIKSMTQGRRGCGERFERKGKTDKSDIANVEAMKSGKKTIDSGNCVGPSDNSSRTDDWMVVTMKRLEYHGNFASGWLIAFGLSARQTINIALLT